MDGIKESSYSLALNQQGTLLATGTAGGLVRVADPRTGGKVCKLRGHTDNVRALAINRYVRVGMRGWVCVCMGMCVYGYVGRYVLVGMCW